MLKRYLKSTYLENEIMTGLALGRTSTFVGQYKPK